MYEYWYAFLYALFVSIFAMVTGGEGAILFVPFFILVGISPQQAIGTAFITQLFGKTSGTVGYLREGGIQWNLLIRLVAVGVPGIILGSWLTYSLNSAILQFSFGLLTMVLALVMLYSLRIPEKMREKVASKELFRWLWVPAIAGFLTGVFAIGAGTINLVLLERGLKLRMHKAVATVVATMAFTALAGALIHFAEGGIRWDVAMFTIPAVLIGGQVGPWLAQRMKAEWIKILFAVLTVLVGLVMCTRAVGLWG